MKNLTEFASTSVLRDQSALPATVPMLTLTQIHSIHMQTILSFTGDGECIV